MKKLSIEKRAQLIVGELTHEFHANIARKLQEHDRGVVDALFCCDGGDLSAGIKLYHTFSSFRGDLTLYVARAQSAGAVAMLGASKRKILSHGTVMFHAALAKFSDAAKVQDLRAAIESATRDNDAVKALIRKHCPNVTPAQWQRYDNGSFAPSRKEMSDLGLFSDADFDAEFPVESAFTVTP